MSTKPRALMALHYPAQVVMHGGDFEYAGYEVVKAESVEGMLQEMGIPEGAAPDTPPTNPFAWYLMDANLGCQGAPDAKAASRIYSHVRDAVESGEARFMSVTGSSEAEQHAREEGIPCLHKAGGPSRLTKMIEESKCD